MNYRNKIILYLPIIYMGKLSVFHQNIISGANEYPDRKRFNYI